MKNSKFKTAALVLALLALGAAFIAVLSAPPANRPSRVTPGPSASYTPAPSRAPSRSPSAAVTPPSPSVTAGPLSGYIIGVDPGHQAVPNPEMEQNSPGGKRMKASVSKGAHGSFTGLPEYELNLSVALKLKDKLESLGAHVIMTRETSDINIPNSQRALMMNDAGVDCWLRIHANNSTSESIRGMFMIAPAKGCLDTPDDAAYEASLRLAEDLLDSALSSTGAHSRGIDKRSDQTGFNWSKLPVCTIEMGFMTNKAEDNLLASGDYQQKIVDGLAQGFVDYFSE